MNMDIIRRVPNMLLTIMEKENLQSELATIRHQPTEVESQLNAYREAHLFDESKIYDAGPSNKFQKALDDLKAGKGPSEPSSEDMEALLRAIRLHTEEKLDRRVAFGKDQEGISIEEIVEKERKICGEVVEEFLKETVDSKGQEK